MWRQYLNLLKTIWTFAKGMRAKFVLTYTSFVMANLVLMVEPYFLGKFFNVIQEGGEELVARSAFWLLMIFVSNLLFWLFHGPARVSERKMGFQINLFKTINHILNTEQLELCIFKQEILHKLS